MLATLCATRPTISPISSLQINVLGAVAANPPRISAIESPIAPAKPPYTPPRSSAPSTTNALPT